MGFEALPRNRCEVIDYPRAVDIIMKEYEQTITI